MNHPKKGILILTPFFSPNIGGVETHLTDLVNKLNDIGHQVYVQTYSPLTTPNTQWKSKETIKNIHICRYFWPGKNIFHRVEKYPIIDFIYLTPYLFLRTFLWMIKNHQKINIIHSHGFNGAFCGVILGKIFSKKHLTSTHALYPNPSNSLTAKISRLILNKTDVILVQSVESEKQLLNWGVQKNKIQPYRYWIDPKKFNSQKIKLNKYFTVIFVSRLILKKGTRIVLKLAQILPQIQFIIIGSGPEEEFIKQHHSKNVKFLGKIKNDQLLDYYSQSDIFIQPALYQEGFTRTIMEAVACGLPVVASNLGTIPEIVDSTVSILVKPTINNFQKAILKIFENKNLFQQMKKNCPEYTKKHFDSKNIELITKYF